jgi:hypothetical protein
MAVMLLALSAECRFTPHNLRRHSFASMGSEAACSVGVQRVNHKPRVYSSLTITTEGCCIVRLLLVQAVPLVILLSP